MTDCIDCGALLPANTDWRRCAGCLRFRSPRPPIVCLCGSTRFFQEFMDANYRLTCEGKIVLSVGFYVNSAEVHGEGVGVTDELKIQLDELHKRKIDLADSIFVIDPGGYVGSSTKSEIFYASAHGKAVHWLEPPGEDGCFVLPNGECVGNCEVHRG